AASATVCRASERTPSVRPTLPRHRQRSHEGVADRLCAEPKTGAVGARCVHPGLRLRTVPAEATPMSAKAVDRYYVINWYRAKGGYWKAESPVERATHEAATATAYLSYLGTVDLAGPDGPNHETWEVFVGSKAALDRYIEARGAR